MEVILVPGLWLTASSWDPVLPALREAGHTPVPLTLPGVGGTAAETADITMDDWVAAVAAEIDRHEGPVGLVGHSGGGNVVWGAAAARPDRVARVVFVDTVPLTRSIPAQAPTSPVTLDDDRRFGVPVTLLMGSLDEAALRAELARWGPYAEEFAAIDDATVVRLGTGHWPQFSAPAALARALVEAFAEDAPREDAPA
ncbi:alpha/beta hydrolase [Microbacterium sp. F2E]|uniref:alpha/beta fold hydrolase n=1 Tax=Microbacterium sp. F2E TaxID=2895284 RepID=UPI001E56B225|nr:alpha/beta hydrolase [Microbacterium sp. F2E]MCC9053441.1 alpha/beta hydrolase [Microbacterium sp. F2E]